MTSFTEMPSSDKPFEYQEVFDAKEYYAKIYNIPLPSREAAKKN